MHRAALTTSVHNGKKNTVLPGCFKENRLKRNKYKRQRRLLRFWLVYNFLSILLCQNVRRKEALVPWYQASGSLAAPSLFLTGVSPSSLMTEVKRRWERCEPLSPEDGMLPTPSPGRALPAARSLPRRGPGPSAPCPIPGSASGSPRASACAAAGAEQLRPGTCRRGKPGSGGWRSAACAGSAPPATGSRTARRRRSRCLGATARRRKAQARGRRAACDADSRSPGARGARGHRRRREGSGTRRPHTEASEVGSSAGTWPGRHGAPAAERKRNKTCATRHEHAHGLAGCGGGCSLAVPRPVARRQRSGLTRFRAGKAKRGTHVRTR